MRRGRERRRKPLRRPGNRRPKEAIAGPPRSNTM